VVPGGLILADSTLIERKVERDDVKVVYIPATRMAGENGISSLANMIIVGKMLAELNDCDEASIEAALAKVVSAKRADMLDANRKALKLGADYVGG
jgi:2-oxoglutarate ferredoxin oxidoreductase subunit gamma